MQSRKRVSRSLCPGLLLGLLAAQPVLAADVARILQLNIPSQPLETALTALARQADLQILFTPDLVRGHRSTEVAGSLSATDALRRLLDGSDIEFVVDDSDTIVLRLRSQPAVRRIAATSAAPATQTDTAPAAPLPAARMLEEIIVSAQKREESLGDVPIAITAVSGESLRESGLVRLEEFAATVPDLTISQAVSSSDNMFLRGVGSGVNLGFEQAVGQVIDGFFYGRSRFGRAAFLDIERVEVLKGPQGALIGKNTSAGAVNITTAKPTKTFEAWVAPSYEAVGDDGFSIEGAVSGPLTSTLGARLALRYEDREGFVDNTATGREEQSKDDFTVRLTTQWSPDAAFGATLAYQYGTYERIGQPREISHCGAPLRAFLAANPSIAEDCRLDHRRNVRHTRNAVALEETFDTVFQTAGLTANWYLPRHTITSLTGFATYTAEDALSNGLIPLEQGAVDTFDDYEQWSQELRIASERTGRVQYVAGLFYQRFDQDARFIVHFPSAPPALRGTRNIDSTQQSTTMAAFGQLTWQFTEQLSATVSGRYTWEEKEAAQEQFPTQLYTRTPITLPGGPAALQHSIAAKRDENDFSPGFTLQWRPRDGAMLYGSVRRGFKGGGFDLQLNANQAAAARDFEFDAEKVIAYELGSKVMLPGRVAEINVAAFRSDFDDLQVSSLTDALSFNVGNAASAVTQGVEVDARWLASRNLTLAAMVAYLDATYDEYPNALCHEGQTAEQGCIGGVQDLGGRVLQFAPEWSATASGEYVWPVSQELELVGFARLTYSDDFALALDLDPYTIQDSYLKVDARITLRAADDRWSVSVIGRNLTDRITGSFGNDVIGPNMAGTYFRFADPPRSVAIQGRLRF